MRKKSNVWSVYHEFEDGAFCEHFKLIGFFRTREQARAVVRSLKWKPGFKDHRKGFFVGKHPLDDGGAWEEGFITVIGDTTMPESGPPIGVKTVLDSDIENSQDSLWHVLHSYVDQWKCIEAKTIGLYSDLKFAKRAVKDRLDQPGFRNRSEGFQIIPVTLGRIEYEDGF